MYRENNENVTYHHIFSIMIDIIYQQKIVLFTLHEAFKININYSLCIRFALTKNYIECIINYGYYSFLVYSHAWYHNINEAGSYKIE